jgi:hypothetical protein
MYGPTGPISGGPDDPQVRALIEGGQAKPAGGPSPAPPPQPPNIRSQPAKPPAKALNTNTAPSRPGPPTADSYNAATVALPEGVDRAALTADPHFGEFSEFAQAEGLNNTQSERLVALHAKALKASYQGFEDAVQGWEHETREALGNQVTHMAATIRKAVGSDADAQRFMELMDWSGLGSNASVLRVLHRLARGY